MVIETERLRLREYTWEDYDALYAILADPETMRFYPKPYDEEKVRGWITWNLKNYREHGFGIWAVTRKDTGEMIGNCGLTIQMIDGEPLPEIGYHIRRDCWRRGYGSEAARAVRDWAFENTGYGCLYSYMKYTNLPSQATAMANGMEKVKAYPNEKDGVTCVYAITRERWAALTGRR